LVGGGNDSLGVGREQFAALRRSEEIEALAE
jgi:hypothetical protein